MIFQLPGWALTTFFDGPPGRRSAAKTLHPRFITSMFFFSLRTVMSAPDRRYRHDVGELAGVEAAPRP